MRKAVVTGASGFIGKALSRKLLEIGVQVYAVVRNKEKMDDISNRNLTVIEASFFEYARLDKIIDETGFDVFYHIAWEGYGKATNDYNVQINNVKYSADAVLACIGLKCRRFVFTGSSHEFLINFYKNNTSVKPYFCSVYGSAKYGADRLNSTLCHNGGVHYNSTIFTNVFGVGDHSMRTVNSLIYKLLRGEKPKLITGKYLYDWTYIDDAIDGLIAVGEKGKPFKRYYVGSRALRPFREIIEEVNEIVGTGVSLDFGGFEDTSRVEYSFFDIYDLYRDTGFLPKCDFRDSVLQTIEWLKSLNMNQ